MAKKMVLVCFKANSKEIVGINVNYVISKNDTFLSNVGKNVCMVCFAKKEN